MVLSVGFSLQNDAAGVKLAAKQPPVINNTNTTDKFYLERQDVLKMVTEGTSTDFVQLNALRQLKLCDSPCFGEHFNYNCHKVDLS